MLHVIAQKFGRSLQPVFLSGVPSVRGMFVGFGRPAALTAEGGIAVTHPPLASLQSASAGFTEEASAGSGPEASVSNATEERTYSDYEIAYQTGFEGFMRHGEKAGSFEAAEPELREEYEQRLPAPEAERPLGTATALAAAQAHLLWEEARHAAKTAWKRAARQLTPRRYQQHAA